MEGKTQKLKVPRKKGHPKFNVPNYGAKSRKRVKERWRKQRGIDNKKRIKMRMMGAEPTIGYRNPESVRHVRASGRKAVIVNNVSEFERLASDKGLDFVIAHSVSRRKRLQLDEAARRHGIRLANQTAKPLEKKEQKPARQEKPKEAPAKPSGAEPANEGVKNEH